MIALADDALDAILGGATSTRQIQTPLASGSVTESDYARCVDTVQRQANEAYPRPAWPWQQDANARPRAQTVLEALPRVCGVPGARP